MPKIIDVDILLKRRGRLKSWRFADEDGFPILNTNEELVKGYTCPFVIMTIESHKVTPRSECVFPTPDSFIPKEFSHYYRKKLLNQFGISEDILYGDKRT